MRGNRAHVAHTRYYWRLQVGRGEHRLSAFTLSPNT